MMTAITETIEKINGAYTVFNCLTVLGIKTEEMFCSNGTVPNVIDEWALKPSSVISIFSLDELAKYKNDSTVGSGLWTKSPYGPNKFILISSINIFVTLMTKIIDLTKEKENLWNKFDINPDDEENIIKKYKRSRAALDAIFNVLKKEGKDTDEIHKNILFKNMKVELNMVSSKYEKLKDLKNTEVKINEELRALKNIIFNNVLILKGTEDDFKYYAEEYFV